MLSALVSGIVSWSQNNQVIIWDRNCLSSCVPSKRTNNNKCHSRVITYTQTWASWASWPCGRTHRAEDRWTGKPSQCPCQHCRGSWNMTICDKLMQTIIRENLTITGLSFRIFPRPACGYIQHHLCLSTHAVLQQQSSNTLRCRNTKREHIWEIMIETPPQEQVAQAVF